MRGGEGEVVRGKGAHDLGEGDRLLFAVAGPEDEFVLLVRLVQLLDLRAQALELPHHPGLDRGEALLRGFVRRGAGPARALRVAQLEARLLHLPVDGPDVLGLDPPAQVPAVANLVVMLLVEPPGLVRAGGGGRAGDQEADGFAVEAAPLLPLDGQRPGRPLLGGDLRLVDPDVVLAGELEIADAHQAPAAGAPRPLLGALDLAHQDLALGRAEADHRAGNEGGKARVGDQAEQSGDHRDRHHQPAAHDPDQGLALHEERGAGALAAAVSEAGGGGRRRAHSSIAFFRKRIRTISARVFRTNVITKSTSAARKSVR